MSKSEISESCHFSSWLMKSCFPNPNDTAVVQNDTPPPKTTISSLPDDVLLDCLSRVSSSSSIHAVAAVSRRWRRLLLSPSFLRLRRAQALRRRRLFALSASSDAVFSAALALDDDAEWKISTFLHTDAVPEFPPHARVCAVGPRIFAVGRTAALRFDAWTGTVTPLAQTIFPRKNFAAAEVAGKIYIAGGGGPGSSAVEEYDPEIDTWRVVAHAPRSRYGCIGASADGVFYVVGGLKLGGEAHVYAGSMDLYDVATRSWLRSRAVPGGGCAVAACAVDGRVFVLASHAVELSFWSFDGRRRGGGFGEWRRVKSPPLPAQARVDGTVRFGCAGVGDKVVLVQVAGCIDDLLRRSGRSGRGMREGLVLVYDTVSGEWTRAPDLPEIIRRAACVGVEC